MQRAKALTEDLLEVVREEHAKVKTILQQQQMGLHQAQVQYAAYSAYGVCMLRSFSPSCQSHMAAKLPLPDLGLYHSLVCSLTHLCIGLCASASWKCSAAPATR